MRLNRIAWRIPAWMLTAAILLVSFSGCTLFPGTREPERPHIAVVAKMLNVDFWQSVRQGAESAAKEYGVEMTFSAPDREEDVDAQIELVRRAIASGAEALVLAASDYERLVPVTEEAVKAGLPVVVIDSDVNTDRIDSFIATDNRDAGAKMGEQMVLQVGEEADIAIMNFVKGSAPADQREAGFLSVTQAHPGLHVVETMYCRSDTTLAEAMTRDLLAAHPQLDAIAALNAMSAIGVARAVSDLGLEGKVKVVSMDNALEQIEFIEAGTIRATVVQKPFAMGYLGIQTALQILDGKKVERVIDTGSTVITQDNLYTPENQKLLFPFVR